MSRFDRTIAVAVSVTIWAGVVALVVPSRAELVGHLWLVAVLALALALALDRLRQAIPSRPSAFDAAFGARGPVHAQPASLARVEREVALATGTAFDVHYRLRPILRSLASGLLLRRGVDLDRRPERARELLGADVWELVRPDREPPHDRSAPGLPVEVVERSIDELERLSWS
jgi:hypothetical protein